MGTKERIEELVDFLNECNKAYYVDCNPTISDYEFDQKLKELQAMERETGYVLPYSPTQRVGSDLQKGFKEVDRTRMMGSIENSYDRDELKDWLESIETVDGSWLLEPKYDGLSLSIIYRDGVLFQGTTRGTGLRGTDVTANIKTIKSIPLKLKINEKEVGSEYEGIYIPHEIEIRGEVLMLKSELRKLNAERIASGLEPFANERNAAAGSLKQLDPAVTASRNLIFKPYGVYCDSDTEFSKKYMKNHHNGLDISHILGFCEPTYWRCVDSYTAISMVNEFEYRFLKNQDYCMDGCVLKVDSIERQDELGYTQKVPRWAKAFKFKQESASTLLKDVIWQVSREGKLSPVAVLDPIEVDGTVIKNAYLNNMDYINANGIKMGSYVFIERGGGVIPKVTGIDFERSEGLDMKDIEEPSVCPCCGSPVMRKLDDGAAVYCTNPMCSDRIKTMLYYFGTKNCMNIKYLGEEIISSLYENGTVRSWSDLYRLSESDIASSGCGLKVASKIYAEIEKSRKNPADVVLASLGIPMCGRVTAGKILSKYGTICDFVKSVNDGSFCVMDGVGEVAAREISEYVLNHPDVFEDVNTYLDPEPVKVMLAESLKLSGKTVLATGTLENFKRDEIEESVVKNGGKYASGVSKKLDFLIVGDAPGASKIEKAKLLGVPMISESEYMEMIK